MADNYFSKMMSYSKQAQDLTKIDYRIILAQWYLESAGGTSDLSKRANNHAGIKSSSKGKDYISGRYAGYNNLSNFTKDYSRVMNLSYYDDVRNAKSLEDQVIALGNSPWAEDKGYAAKIFDVIKKNDLANIIAANIEGNGTAEKAINFIKSPIVIGGLALIIVGKDLFKS